MTKNKNQTPVVMPNLGLMEIRLVSASGNTENGLWKNYFFHFYVMGGFDSTGNPNDWPKPGAKPIEQPVSLRPREQGSETREFIGGFEFSMIDA